MASCFTSCFLGGGDGGAFSGGFPVKTGGAPAAALFSGWAAFGALAAGAALGASAARFKFGNAPKVKSPWPRACGPFRPEDDAARISPGCGTLAGGLCSWAALARIAASMRSACV